MTTTPRAVVTAGDLRRELRPGESLSFGRGRDADLRFAHDPLDDHVSRTAGRLECGEGTVTIHNDSDTATLAVRTSPGGGDVPPMTALVVRRARVEVVVPGSEGRTFSLHLDAGELWRATSTAPTPDAPTPDGTAPDGITAGFTPVTGLPDRDRTVLAVLCAPSWRSGRRTDVPSYGTVAAVLARSGTALGESRVRAVLDQLRKELATVHGVQGVWYPTDSPLRRANVSYLQQLAWWAQVSGTVTAADVAPFLEEG